MAVVLRHAVYASPRLSADEDALTLMLEAARLLLRDGERPDRLALASLSLPYTRRVQAGLMAEALSLPPSTFCLECTTSARAATEAIRALGTGLVLAADGGYGAALLLADDGTTAGGTAPGAAPGGTVSGIPAEATLLAAQSALADYPGLEFTPAGEQGIRDVAVPGYSEAAYLDLVAEAARGLQADWLALNPPQPRLARRAAAHLGFREAVQAPADSGAAGPLVALSAALERAQPGQRILLVSYGAGSAADALLVQKGGL